MATRTEYGRCNEKYEDMNQRDCLHVDEIAKNLKGQAFQPKPEYYEDGDGSDKE